MFGVWLSRIGGVPFCHSPLERVHATIDAYTQFYRALCPSTALSVQHHRTSCTSPSQLDGYLIFCSIRINSCYRFLLSTARSAFAEAGNVQGAPLEGDRGWHIWHLRLALTADPRTQMTRIEPRKRFSLAYRISDLSSLCKVPYQRNLRELFCAPLSSRRSSVAHEAELLSFAAGRWRWYSLGYLLPTAYRHISRCRNDTHQGSLDEFGCIAWRSRSCVRLQGGLEDDFNVLMCGRAATTSIWTSISWLLKLLVRSALE
ncbi:hypothetical protein C8Q70DRAFT_270723 [Cubamyces menziesii]|nr:hypothetical protein C8Q70DRAFT_270723 [Cubamyces menziesii]